MKKEKTLTELLIEWDQCNKQLDRIKNDPEYIEQITARVFKGKTYKVDIDQILTAFNKA